MNNFTTVMLCLLLAAPTVCSAQVGGDGCSQSKGTGHWGSSSSATGVEVSVLDDKGRAFPQYPVARHRRSHTAKRAYLEARAGASYSIKVRNHSPYRLGLVIAVDGRNILSGKASDLRNTERMYVLAPSGTGVYKGWRTSKNQVHRFFFTDAEDSYAAAFDDDTAMGTIAIAVYCERRQPPSFAAQPAPRMEQRSRPGTGFGEAESSPSRTVDFTPEHHAWRKIVYKYEWRETLCELGIAQCRHSGQGNRFWPDPPETEPYAPYPPGYDWHHRPRD